MPPVLRNILAVVTGALIGGAINMGLILLSGHVIPPPAGVDVTTVEGLKAGIHLFGPQHFIFPFLAHALGTLSGAFIAALIAISNRMRVAMIVGILFLVGGIMDSYMLPAPMWFIALDILAAYLPMGWLAYKLAVMVKK